MNQNPREVTFGLSYMGMFRNCRSSFTVSNNNFINTDLIVSCFIAQQVNPKHRGHLLTVPELKMSQQDWKILEWKLD